MEGKLGRSARSDGVNEPCKSCASACCGPYIRIVLSNQERDFLRTAGTILSEIAHFPDNGINKTLYSLDSKCGFAIKENGLYKCIEHDNPKRPDACKEFKAGSELCKTIKESRKTGIGYEFGY